MLSEMTLTICEINPASTCLKPMLNQRTIHQPEIVAALKVQIKLLGRIQKCFLQRDMTLFLQRFRINYS